MHAQWCCVVHTVAVTMAFASIVSAENRNALDFFPKYGSCAVKNDLMFFEEIDICAVEFY